MQRKPFPTLKSIALLGLVLILVLASLNGAATVVGSFLCTLTVEVLPGVALSAWQAFYSHGASHATVLDCLSHAVVSAFPVLLTVSAAA
jgi:hypothetical protein